MIGWQKKFYNMLWRRGKQSEALPAEMGYSKGKRREGAILSQRVVSWRLKAARISHPNVFYDMKMFFGVRRKVI